MGVGSELVSLVGLVRLSLSLPPAHRPVVFFQRRSDRSEDQESHDLRSAQSLLVTLHRPVDLLDQTTIPESRSEQPPERTDEKGFSPPFPFFVTSSDVDVGV